MRLPLAHPMAVLRRVRGRSPAPVLAVVLPADEELTAEVRALQGELARACGVACDTASPPHVTLKLGFSARDPEAVAEWLSGLAATQEALEIEIRGLGEFEEGILFLDVARSAELSALQQRVVGELRERLDVPVWPLEGRDVFHFHVTVARDLAPEHLVVGRRLLAPRVRERRLAVDRLELLRAFGEGWSAWRGYPLRSRRRTDRAP
jgi:2'-5' RNA ligase